MIDLSGLVTEKRNPATMHLDQMSPLEIATVMNEEDRNVVEAVRKVLPEVAQVITWCIEGMKKGGRLIYIGAGTSGRLGVLDAVECPPTFGVEPEQVVGLMAGGEKAFVKAVEGAEDDLNLGKKELQAVGVCENDVVIGLAASGRTPYVIGALNYAREIGCKTAAIVCNKGSEVARASELAIEPVCGPEVLTGSTRLKAGTSQKMILNMISTGSMIGIGKVYENLMVDVQQTNKKLAVRAENIVMEATGCRREIASEALKKAKGNAKRAIIMILLGCDFEKACELLNNAEGHIRKAIKK